MHLCKEIEDLDDFYDYYEDENTPNHGQDTPPCYQNHVTDTELLPKEVHPGEYLSLLATHIGDDKMITYSVTDQEPNYKEWVEVAQTIPGATVTVIDRGNRFCYFCCVPCTPNMDLV